MLGIRVWTQLLSADHLLSHMVSHHHLQQSLVLSHLLHRSSLQAILLWILLAAHPLSHLYHHLLVLWKRMMTTMIRIGTLHLQ